MSTDILKHYVYYVVTFSYCCLMFSFSLNWLNVTHPLLIYMQQQPTIGCCSFDSWKLEKSRCVPTNPLLLCNVRLLWREKPIDIPASVSVFVCKWAACIHKIQNSHPLHTQSLSFWQQTQLLYWGHHYKLSRGGLRAPWPLLQTHTQHGRLDYDH